MYFVCFRSNLSVDSQPIKYGDELMLSDINGQVNIFL